MPDRFQKAPKPHLEQAATRYSKSIPPERKGRTSGMFRVDTRELEALRKTYVAFDVIPGEKRKEWLIGGVLLRSINTWKILSPEITENDCEERREMLSFIAGEYAGRNGEKKYGPLPSIEAITIELGRLVLEAIPEWNQLDPSAQFLLERDVLEFISRPHAELDDEEKKPDKMTILLAPHAPPDMKTAEYYETREKKRQTVMQQITDRILELAEEYEIDIFRDDVHPAQETKPEGAIARQIAAATRTAILPPDSDEEGLLEDELPPPTKPEIPRAKRDSGKPANDDDPPSDPEK